MATNYVQRGDTVDLTAAAAVSSGDGILVGELFGVAQTDAGIGERVPCVVSGVVTLPKTAPLVIDEGDRVFWDPTPGEVNLTSAAQVCVGIAVNGGALSAAPTVEVLLRGSTPAGT